MSAALAQVEQETPDTRPEQSRLKVVDQTPDPTVTGLAGKQQSNLESRRTRCKNAVFVEDMTMKALKEMRESLSFAGENAKDNALALAAVGRLWDAAQERIRILKGEALPLGVKVEPKKAKRRALRPAPSAPIRPPADPVPDQASAGTPQEPPA